MTPEPRQTLAASEALALLQAGRPLLNCHVSGQLDLASFDYWEEEVVLEDCTVESFACCPTQFIKPVRLLNCRFKSCDFTFVYSLSGLLIDRCLFEQDLDFQAGGHNKPGHALRLTDNDFAGFVNFFDCQYESEVTITGNNFRGGTNLLGRPHAIAVTFAVPPVIKGNAEQLDADTEGT